MPDFTIHVTYMCSSCENFEALIKGSKGQFYKVRYGRTPQGPYQYGWSCSCPSFKFNPHNNCKHIVEAMTEEWCGWNNCCEMATPDYDSNGNPVCPRCKGSVVPMRIAV